MCGEGEIYVLIGALEPGSTRATPSTPSALLFAHQQAIILERFQIFDYSSYHPRAPSKPPSPPYELPSHVPPPCYSHSHPSILPTTPSATPQKIKIKKRALDVDLPPSLKNPKKQTAAVSSKLLNSTAPVKAGTPPDRRHDQKAIQTSGKKRN